MGAGETEAGEDEVAVAAEPPWLEALRRNSGLALDGDGRWTWGGNEAENVRVQALFHRGVAVRDDGEVTLRVGKMWTYVTCPGPAYFLRAVRIEGGRVIGRFLGERELDLAGAVAGWGPDDRLYLWVDGLPGPARALREAHQVLLDRLRDGPTEAAWSIDFGGSEHGVSRAERGRPSEPEGARGPSGPPDTSPRDTSPPDTSPPDTRQGEVHVPDLSIPIWALPAIPGPRAPRPGIGGPVREMILAP